MKKRNILMVIIGMTGILNIVLSRVLTNFTPIWELLLTVPFYVIIIIFYRKTKLITAFCVLTILSQFGYYMVLANIDRIAMLSPIMRVYGSMSFFLGIVGFLVAFMITLQHKTYKFTEVSFLIFSVVNYVFFSYYNFYFINMLVTIFGPFELHIIQMMNIYEGVLIFVEIAVIILQVIMIAFLERNKWFELRLRLRDQEIMNSKITD